MMLDVMLTRTISKLAARAEQQWVGEGSPRPSGWCVAMETRAKRWINVTTVWKRNEEIDGPSLAWPRPRLT